MSALSATAKAYGAGFSPYAANPASNRIGNAGPGGATSREAELTQQLDARLTGQLARIRSQIQPATEAGSPSTEGLGQIVDIRA